MKNINYVLALTIILSSYSCKIQSQLNYSSEFNMPEDSFNDNETVMMLDYSDEKNWAFRSDINDHKKILPRNYNLENDKMFNVSVFYIHPTTLFSSKKWNADTTHFFNNKIIGLCIENQASVFAGIADLYAPHYREMHIYSYTDTVNGYKAFDVAYNDIVSSFDFFLKTIKTEKFIIASHSQGTNHAKKLINEYIYPDTNLRSKLILSYLIGMDIKKKEMLIDLCKEPNQLDCFLNWRTFNASYYPNDWNYGNNYTCVNPITFSNNFLWSENNLHKGILFPNRKILLKRILSAKNEKGILWVKFKKNIFINKFKRNSYHNADFNLFWVNIRSNLIERLEFNSIKVR